MWGVYAPGKSRHGLRLFLNQGLINFASAVTSGRSRKIADYDRDRQASICTLPNACLEDTGRGGEVGVIRAVASYRVADDSHRARSDRIVAVPGS